MAISADNLRFILGLKLKNLRQEKGMSLKALAESAGLSISYLSEIEKGKKYPKPDKLLLQVAAARHRHLREAAELSRLPEF